jgi:hypothetical protein
LLDLFFDPENGSKKFLRNEGKLHRNRCDPEDGSLHNHDYENLILSNIFSHPFSICLMAQHFKEVLFECLLLVDYLEASTAISDNKIIVKNCNQMRQLNQPTVRQKVRTLFTAPKHGSEDTGDMGIRGSG